MFFLLFLLIKELNFRLVTDHFSLLPSEYFTLHGFEDRSFFKGNETKNIILTICGNGAINSEFPFPAPVKEIAARTNSVLLSLEQRFFGKSTLFPNTTSENLRLLTIDQINADIAVVLNKYNQNCVDGKCRVLIVGAGDSADIAAWFRLHYPHLTIGAWSSFGSTDTPPFDSEYDQRLINRMTHYSQKCFTETARLLKSIEWTLECHTEEEKAKLYDMFEITNDTHPMNALYMFNEMFSLMNYMTEGNRDIFGSYCDNITRYPEIENLASYYKYILERNKLNSTTFNPAILANESQSFPQRTKRLTWYMKCTQTGRFPISNGFRSKKMDEDFYKNECDNMFKLRSLGGINFTRTCLGGKEYGGTNVLFTRMKHDLNSAVMTKAVPRNNVAVFEVPNVMRSFDMFPDAGQSNEAKRAKRKIKDTLVSWMNDDCETKCVHGKCSLNKCVCDGPWSGEFCDVPSYDSASVHTFSIFATIVPTIILIVVGMIGWWVFVIDDINARIVI